MFLLCYCFLFIVFVIDSRSLTSSAVCPPGEVVSVSLNEVVHLQCPEASHLAKRYWKRLNSQLSPKIYIQLDNSSLGFVTTASTLGHYLCQAEENGYTQTLIVYHVKQKSHLSITPVGPTQPHYTSDAETKNKSSFYTPKWTTLQSNTQMPELGCKPEQPQPTVPQNDTSVFPMRKSRNFTCWTASEEEKSQMIESGGNLQMVDKRTYLQELVVVSVLLALCIGALLTIIFYKFRLPCHSRTVPQTPSFFKDGERERGVTPQEREVLQRQLLCVEMHNGHIVQAPIIPCNSTMKTFNGHLPNTPI